VITPSEAFYHRAGRRAREDYWHICVVLHISPLAAQSTGFDGSVYTQPPAPSQA
jgi:hypothetical protein